MFPDVQKKVMDEISKVFTAKNSYGKTYLSVGSALIVSVNSEKFGKKLMISAPTMDIPRDMPRDIRKTPENVYYAMIAILEVCRLYGLNNNSVVAIPGLGTLTGKLTPEESAEQILKAYLDYKNGLINNNNNIDSGPTFYIKKS